MRGAPCRGVRAHVAAFVRGPCDSAPLLAAQHSTMYVIKRNGRQETVLFDKITSRIKKLCYGLDSKYIKPNVLTQRRE